MALIPMEYDQVGGGIIGENKSDNTQRSIAANGVYTGSINVAKTGYTPMAVIPSAIFGTNGLCFFNQCYISTSTTATIQIANMYSAAQTVTSILIMVLYKKND